MADRHLGMPHISERWKKSLRQQPNQGHCAQGEIISAYNEFIERRPQGDSMVALQEVLEDLRQQEQELAELMMQRLITKAAYEEERKSVKMQITDISEKISERRANVCPKASMCRLQNSAKKKQNDFYRRSS